jgi:hypothetical protein
MPMPVKAAGILRIKACWCNGFRKQLEQFWKADSTHINRLTKVAGVDNFHRFPESFRWLAAFGKLAEI